MKILLISQGYYPAIGGTENLMQNLAEGLVRDYDDAVTVFTTNCFGGDAFHLPDAPVIPVERETINGVQVRRFPVRRRLSWLFYLPQHLAFRLDLPFNQYLRLMYQGPLMKGLGQAIADHPADIILASSFPLMHMFVALKAGRKTHRPVLLHGALHPKDIWGFQRPMITKAVRSADHYIANSEYEKRHLVEKGVDVQKITTIGVGVNPGTIYRIDRRQARAALGLGDGPVVGFIGQIAEHKGVGCLLEAMEQVWKVCPETTLLIAGARRHFTNAMEATIAAWPQEWQDRVLVKYNFAEHEKPLLFNAVDIFAYPSGFESFGIAYLEAWSARKPVIGTWEGAIPSVVSAGKDGLLADYLDEDELAEAILILLKSPAFAAKLGWRGHRKVLRHYTWPIVTAKFRQVFSRLLH
jgi:glycosyltransferase involved in cell wall biosynthesis